MIEEQCKRCYHPRSKHLDTEDGGCLSGNCDCPDFVGPDMKCALCGEPPGNTVIDGRNKPVHSGWIPHSRVDPEVGWHIHSYVPPPPCQYLSGGCGHRFSDHPRKSMVGVYASPCIVSGCRCDGYVAPVSESNR